MAKSKTAGKTKAKGKAKAKRKASQRVPGPATRAAEVRPMPEAERVAVVVLTMHRSGSSAISRVLNLLGCDAPKTLIAADSNNQSGYWESDVLRVFNDNVLASAGTNWRDWLPFNADWYSTPRFSEFLTEGREAVASEYGSSRFFFYKDPRICRCVPLWREILEGMGIEPRVIMSIRHPIEVARSLAARDDIPELEAVLLWLRHMLDAEHDSRGLKRAFVSYDRLISDPVGTMKVLEAPLDLHWPRLSNGVAAEIEGFMTADLRHHRAEEEDRVSRTHMLQEFLETVYGILLRWSREGGEDAADHGKLDQIRTDLTHLSGTLGTLVEALSTRSHELKNKSATVAKLTEEQHTLNADLNAARKALSALKEDHAALQTEGEQLVAGRELAKQELARLAKDLIRRDDEINELQAQLHTQKSTLEQRSHEAEETAKALEEARGLIEQREQEAEVLHASLAEANADNEGAQRELAQLARDLIQRDDEINELQAQLHTQKSTLEERDRALVRLRGNNSDLNDKVTSQAGDLAQMAQLILQKEEALKRRNLAAHEAENESAALRGEVSQLREEVEARSAALVEAEVHRQEILGSTSWKLTAPLRRLISLMRH